MKRVWHEAIRRLRGKRRSAAGAAAAQLAVFLAGAVSGSIVQRLLLRTD